MSHPADKIIVRAEALRELEGLLVERTQERDRLQRVGEICGADADRWAAKYQAANGQLAALRSACQALGLQMHELIRDAEGSISKHTVGEWADELRALARVATGAEAP